MITPRYIKPTQMKIKIPIQALLGRYAKRIPNEISMRPLKLMSMALPAANCKKPKKLAYLSFGHENAKINMTEKVVRLKEFEIIIIVKRLPVPFELKGFSER